MLTWTYPKLRKTKDSWYIEYYYIYNGKKKRIRVTENLNRIESLRERTQQANKIIAGLTKLLEAGWNPYENEQHLSLKQSVALILEEIKADYARSTFDNYRTSLYRFEDWCEAHGIGHKVKEISSKDIVQFVNQSPAPNQAIKFLKAFFNRLIDQEIVDRNPVKLKEKKRHVKPRIPLTPTEKQRIKDYLSTIHPRFLLFIETMYYCGLRPKELLQVKFGDIQDNEIYILPEVAKVRVQQKAPCPEYIRSQLIGEPDQYVFSKLHSLEPGLVELHRNRVSEMWKILVKEKLGIKKDMYSVRHLSAIDHYRNNKDMYSLMRFLRHSNISMTQNYMNGLVGFSMEVNLDAGLDF